MFAAQQWKNVLLEKQGRKPVKLMLVSIQNAIAEEEALHVVETTRKVQVSQQENWDDMNNDSFPASDAVARF